AGAHITLPWGDRNLGNRLSGSAEVRRQQALLDEAKADVVPHYHAAGGDYPARRSQITDIVVPLRRNAAELARLAQAAYVQGGVDLLRLLAARKAATPRTPA